MDNNQYKLEHTTFSRPEWDQVIPYIDGGEAAWKELSVGKSSNQLVGVLVGSLVGKDNPGPVEEFFEGEVRIESFCLIFR